MAARRRSAARRVLLSGMGLALSRHSMGRPLRRHAPGTCYLVTSRCHQARFFLRPEYLLNGVVLEWLARSQAKYPDVHLLALCVMSNHLHVLLRDLKGQLAGWAGYFFGNLARSVNDIRDRRGVVFERRYDAEPVLDEEALLERAVYVICNPVKAGLCEHSHQWPGIVLWAGSGEVESHEVSWLDRESYRSARRRAERVGGPAPAPEGSEASGSLLIHPLAGDRLGEAIKARECQLTAERKRAGRATMTRAAVLAQDWHAAPPRPKRSPRPLCHTSERSLRQAFVEGFREFVGAFREASARWREGCSDVQFPPWSYPPGRPLVRVAYEHPG